MTAIDVAIRLDGDRVGDLVAFLDGDGGAYLAVREVADSGEHYHVILRTEKKVSAVRSAWKRAFPDLTGNGTHSIVLVRDKAKYERYICKGDGPDVCPEVVGANGIQYADVNWQNDQHRAYWEENARITQARKSEHVNDVVMQECKKRKIEWHDRLQIAKIYIKEVSDRNKPINLFSVKSNVNLIQVKLCPDDRAIDDLAAFVCGQ